MLFASDHKTVNITVQFKNIVTCTSIFSRLSSQKWERKWPCKSVRVLHPTINYLPSLLLHEQFIEK